MAPNAFFDSLSCFGGFSETLHNNLDALGSLKTLTSLNKESRPFFLPSGAPGLYALLNYFGSTVCILGAL